MKTIIDGYAQMIIKLSGVIQMKSKTKVKTKLRLSCWAEIANNGRVSVRFRFREKLDII